MRCRACEIRLDPDDNYCRKCGAPVRMLEPAPLHERADVVRIGPAAPALLASAARPIATGAAAVAAGALMRFAVRRAMRSLLGGAARPTPAPAPHAPARRAEQAAPAGTVRVTEVYWYRRIVRS